MSLRTIDPTPRRALMFTPMETRRELLVEAAVVAERLGYEAVAVPEGWGLDATVVLAEMAVRTERIRLVAGIVSVWGRSSATLAMAAASLDDLSGGRFVLGLGASTPVLAERFHRRPFRDPSGELARTVGDVRTLLGGGRIAVDGGRRGLTLGCRARADVPIWVAGLGPRSTAVATSLADGWFPVVVPRDHLSVLRARAASATDGDPLVVCGPLAATGSGQERLEGARQLAGWYLTGMGTLYGDLVRAAGYVEEVDALRAANPRPVPGAVVWPSSADPLLEQLVAGATGAVGPDLDRWDAVTDVVAVGVGPAPRPEVLEAIEAAAPPTAT